MSKETFYGILFSVGAVAGVILGAVARFDKTVSIILGLLLGVVVVVIAAKQQARKNKAAAEKQKRIEEEARQQLIRELENGKWVFPVETLHAKFAAKFGEIDSPEVKEATYQRAKIIAEEVLAECEVPQQYFEQYTGRNAIEQYFAEIWERKQEEVRKANEQKLAQLRMEEESFEKECTRYTNYIGRDKSIQYCQDQIEYYRDIIWRCDQNERSVRNGGNMLYETGKGRESSWAIHGGIASGIAGGAAGVAVAADVQRRNTQVQQQNAQLAQSIAQLSVMSLDRIWKEKHRAEESLEYWNKCLERAKLLLVQTLDENGLVAQLDPKAVGTENSPTGAVKIKVEFQATPDLVIYENVRAVADGSVRVLLSADGKTVGSTVCAVKYTGATSKHTVECICMKVSKQAEKYDVSFTPNHLWAIERN